MSSDTSSLIDNFFVKVFGRECNRCGEKKRKTEFPRFLCARNTIKLCTQCYEEKMDQLREEGKVKSISVSDLLD